MSKTTRGIILAALVFLPVQGRAADPPQNNKNGLTLEISGGFLNIRFLTDSIARVAYSRDRDFFKRASIDVLKRPLSQVHWSLQTTAGIVQLRTAELTLSLDRVTGLVRFLTPNGAPILNESGRDLTPALVQGERTFHVRQTWESNPDESLYGLGQNQFGFLDLKGLDLDLWQHNTNVAIPFLVSSRGYGLLWDNASFTRFGDLRPFTAIPPENLLDRDRHPGGLTVEPLDHSVPASQTADLRIDIHPKRGDPKPPSTLWQGYLLAPKTGDYLFQCRSNGGIKVWIDGRLVIQHWRQGWLADKDMAKARLESGRLYPVKIQWDTEQGTSFQFAWKTPSPNQDTSLWSEVGGGVDYYFVEGPSLDRVVAGYRYLTGRAPLPPSWAFGLWQSRQRYETSQQSLDVVESFREKGIPFDVIVQDWRYWPDGTWGSHQFDPVRFPDPEGWIRKLHALNAHVIISVWGKFYPGTKNFKEMNRHGFLFKSLLKEKIKDWLGYPYSFYDAFNPGARRLFWGQIDRRLFRKGLDGWWLDSTEPDLLPSPPDRESVETRMNPTSMGPGSRVLNAYPLLNSEGIYGGQRGSAPNQRVMILTRSGFAGSQRTSSAIWSGDVTADWSVFAKQIPAGLNLSLSGIPYWTTDIGGYTLPRRFADASPGSRDEEEWRELNVRWFQFGAFCPLLRSHGELRKREMWEFGGVGSPAYKAMLKFDRIRYRLFPYLYSTAWEVTREGGTFMRPLVMDFPGDNDARGLTDEYMFGRAFLVAPVTHFQARNREVYLPDGAKWYDFWTGKVEKPGIQTVAAPYDSMPLFLRAGSIVPMGPEIQYISQKPQEPITLYLYTGSDGDFTLYEDDGLTYGYEKGRYSEIPIHWDDDARRLTLGDREGSFHGMEPAKIFRIILVSPSKPSGFSFDPRPDTEVSYKGEKIVLSL